MWEVEVGLELAVLAKTHLHLLAPRMRLDVDVGHALRVRLDDHRVDQPHQRVVGLLDRLVVVAPLLLLLLLQRLHQLAGIVELELEHRRRRRGGAMGPHIAAEALVYRGHRRADGAGARQRRHHLGLRDEFDLIELEPRRGVFDGDDQLAIAYQQGQRGQAHCSGEG